MTAEPCNDARIHLDGGRTSSLLATLIARAGGRRNSTGPLNLFLVLGRNPRLFRGWLRFAAKLMPFGKLPRKETELAILRVAHLLGSEYERVQHERIGLTVGLSQAEIDDTARDDATWPTRRAAIIAATDQLIGNGDIDDAAWLQLTTHLNEREIIELVMLVSHYQMLATTIRALRIPLEQPN